MELAPLVGMPVAVLAYVLPGLALARREEWQRAEPIELAAIACAGSLAWWAVGIWFIGFVHVSLSAFAVASVVAAALLLLLRRHDIRAAAVAWRNDPEPALLAAGFIAVMVALRAMFAATRLSCSVGDMSAHAYMTELVVMRDGLPETFEPFLPLGDFGSFPPGFHALSAIQSLVGGVPSYRSTIHVLCFSLAAMTFTLYALLRGLGIRPLGSAVGAAAALLLARNPQLYAQWGGAPMLASVAVVFLVTRDALRLDERHDVGVLARLGLLSAGTLLLHQLPVASFAYVFPLLALLRLRRDRQRWFRLVANGAGVAVVAALLAVPFAGRTPLSLPADVLSWARDWFRWETGPALRLQEPVLRALGASGSATQAGPWTWPFYLVIYFGVLPVALLFGGIAVRWLRQRDYATTVATAIVALHVVLFVGAMTEALPMWPALYPSRIGIWLAPAFAIALAGLGSVALALVPRRYLTGLAILWAALFAWEGARLSEMEFGSGYYESAKTGRSSVVAMVANEAVGGPFWIATFSRDNAVLTQDDLTAFAWIRKNTSERAVFGTNPGDGGNMIAAIAHRAVAEPHFNLQFFYRREIEEWFRTPVDYIYVSSEASPAHARRYTADVLDSDAAYRLAFRVGEARVYQRVR